MLSKVYKELMILGFISFVLLMIRQFADLPLTQLLMFELSHVWIFLVAVFFVVHAIIFMLLVRKVKRHWDATAHMEVPELLQKCVLHRGGCPPDTGVLPGVGKGGKRASVDDACAHSQPTLHVCQVPRNHVLEAAGALLRHVWPWQAARGDGLPHREVAFPTHAQPAQQLRLCEVPAAVADSAHHGPA